MKPSLKVKQYMTCTFFRQIWCIIIIIYLETKKHQSQLNACEGVSDYKGKWCKEPACLYILAMNSNSVNTCIIWMSVIGQKSKLHILESLRSVLCKVRERELTINTKRSFIWLTISNCWITSPSSLYWHTPNSSPSSSSDLRPYITCEWWNFVNTILQKAISCTNTVAIVSINMLIHYSQEDPQNFHLNKVHIIEQFVCDCSVGHLLPTIRPSYNGQGITTNTYHLLHQYIIIYTTYYNSTYNQHDIFWSTIKTSIRSQLPGDVLNSNTCDPYLILQLHVHWQQQN